MKIPLNARVQCTDGPGGRVVQVIVNPITRKMTHVVVEEKKAATRRTPGTDPIHCERLVMS